ncbi:MAG: Ig-like domain-containing protein [Acidobacteriaceae bacterium]|nr:Ig-like domain-containing protein [Acidobacteriaceae bacterium]
MKNCSKRLQYLTSLLWCALVLALLVCLPATNALADPIWVRHVSPRSYSRNICIDTPLYLTFNQQPVLGSSGTVRVYQADNTLVDTIDVADPNSFKRPIGGATYNGQPYLFNYYPVIITGNTAAIYLHQPLNYGQTYYVLIDAGVFQDSHGDSFRGFNGPYHWRFRTKLSGPPPGATRLVVDADGHADFCTVQGAIDFVPQNNTQRVVIDVRRGTYTEIVYLRSNKPFITVEGEDRNATVIQYANNNNLNQVSLQFRALFNMDANDFVLQNITLHNTTPHLGSQAEAFRGFGARTLLNRVNLSSFQDTLLLQNRAFVTNSYIEGDVDFMWGGGQVFFEDCELKALNPAYYTQIRNAQGSHGNVYVNCILTRAPNVADASSYLSRIDPNGFPFSEVVFINAAMDAHIKPVGWLLNNADCSMAASIHFAEYHSTDLNGNPIDTSQRLACSSQLTDDEAAQLSDPNNVIGWVPMTVNASPDSVSAGDNIAVNWSAPAGHSGSNYVGLYRVGAPDDQYLTFQYIGDATTGTLNFAAPSDAGRYEFRYFGSDGTRLAISNRVYVQ